MPEQLRERDGIAVELREAPGGRGTEIHVRRTDGTVPDDEIRRAPRTGRSQLEVGYVLGPGVARTTPTPLNRAPRAATLLGVDRVIVIDRYDFRLHQDEKFAGAETLNYERDDVAGELRQRGGGRGPDVCIEAVGTEARTPGPQFAYAGFVDRFPLGALMNKGLTVRGAQRHGQRYIPMVLERMARAELTSEHLATHVMPLEQGPEGYRMFKGKEDNRVRAVFRPN
jgi:zinc-binding dehydrogenase